MTRTRRRIALARLLAPTFLLMGAGPHLTAEILPPERRTVWNPGLNSVGGIPNRTTIYTTLNAATYGNGANDATAAIQAAIDNCPAGQVVQLSAGTFRIASGPIQVNKGITLRGAGPDQTTLKAPDGTGNPVIVVGTRWPSFTGSTNLTANAAKGTNSVTLASVAGLAVGQIVLLDQVTNPNLTQWSPSSPPGDPSRGWQSRMDRPVAQIVEIAGISGNTVTFTTPLHIAFDTAYTAQLSRFSVPAVKNAGVEDLKAFGGEGHDQGGNFYVQLAAYSWLRNVESHMSRGSGIHLYHSFRCVIRDSYIHESKNPNPGGDGYGLDISKASADNLIENNISWLFNKVMVMRASGGGNVIAYNYMEDGIIGYQLNWVESGLNASHMTTPHYELFEGNQGFNFDGESTWGNSIYITVFRNHLTGKRRDAASLGLTDEGFRRAASLNWGHWWYSFVGNVLGYAGMTPAPFSAFAYETFYPWNSDPVGLWKVGVGKDWGPADPQVVATLIRHGNFDYFTSTVKWDAGIDDHTLPNSLYLTNKPAFFGSRTWPWVDPIGTTKVYILPAKARFDAMAGSPPSITTQPSNATVSVGQTATFSVVATGTAPLSYQWQKNGTNINGATSASYATPATVAGDNGATFRVVVTNALGSATSSSATLTVTASDTTSPTVALTAPAAGATVSNTCTVSADAADNVGVVGVQFKLDGANLGAEDATPPYSVSWNTTTAANGSHTLAAVARDAAGNATTSAAVTVTVANTSLTIGETAVLGGADNGNGNLLVAQQAALAQTATLQSLSFYVTNAAGKLRLGVYDATGPNGGPGAKKAETPELVPVTGWNTANVTAPISLVAGNYWLAYLASDNGLAFRKELTGAGRYDPYTYGPMPATFSTSPTAEAVHWSLYATLSIAEYEVAAPLAAGYTLIALPLTPTAPLTAEGLGQRINAQVPSPNCTSVIGYEAGAFVTHPVGTAVNNFTLAVGKGYFVRCATAGTWRARGFRFIASSAPVPLAIGYNLAGLPLEPASAGKYTAESAAQEINAQGGGATQVIDYDPATGQFITHPVGTAVSNFPLALGRGYFIRCAKESTWTVTRN